MTTLVLDTSVIVKWLNSDREDLVKEAREILVKCQKGKVRILAPELSKFEIGNALWKRGLTISQASLSFELFYEFPLEFSSWDLELSKLTSEIAIKHNITYYDASFIALAVKNNATLITANPKHQKISLPGAKITAL